MKKVFLIVALSMMTATAIAAHGPAGCGLGALVFKDKKGTMWNVLAATTNGTSGNQTFGMSTGTLGCEDASTARVAAVNFLHNNLVTFSNDIANGQGKVLDAYLVLIDRQDISKTLLKKNYDQIFSKGNAQEIHNTILTIINA